MNNKTEIFLLKLKNKGLWNNNYDYSKVDLCDYRTKVIIIDKLLNTEHEITPERLLNGIECNFYNCITKNIFLIQKFNEIHNNKFDYSLVNYKNNKTKIRIICKEHGEFSQTPLKHIEGNGCPRCISDRCINLEDVIKKANIIHQDKYKYSLVDYKNYHIKVKIICPSHGVFEQTLSSHIQGKSGCPKCYSINQPKNEEIIVKELMNIHNNKYDYSMINYKNAKTKINIICKEHGIFKQFYNIHKRGHGCPKCYGHHKTNEEIIEKCNKIHNNKYDYSLVNYVNNKTKIDIICHKHGSFKQLLNNHLKGNGCPKCNFSYGEKAVANLLNKMNIEFIPQYKILECKNKKALIFDFYIPEYNLLIEYNGIQHYKPINHFGSESFKQQQINDEIKIKYCKDNNIKLLIIPYTEFDFIDNVLGTKIKEIEFVNEFSKKVIK